MKCRRCGQRAVLDLKSHNTAFCAPCLFAFMERQVKRAIEQYQMFGPEDRVLVCVSGGKDSLTLWDILLRLGYQTAGLYVDLGIQGYSRRSREKVEGFAGQRGLEVYVVSLEELGSSVEALARRNRRAECAVCGIVKRHFFNRTAVEKGFSVVATGHNLDDEASRLMGNLLHWQWEYLDRQAPVLPAVGERLARKVQPLCRVSERETAAYSLLRGIDYILEECPMSDGATSLRYKQVLNLLEDWMPGVKGNFYHGFLKHKKSLVNSHKDMEKGRGGGIPGACSLCGFFSHMDPCAFCRLIRAQERGTQGHKRGASQRKREWRERSQGDGRG